MNGRRDSLAWVRLLPFEVDAVEVDAVDSHAVLDSTRRRARHRVFLKPKVDTVYLVRRLSPSMFAKLPLMAEMISKSAHRCVTTIGVM